MKKDCVSIVRKANVDRQNTYLTCVWFTKCVHSAWTISLTKTPNAKTVGRMNMYLMDLTRLPIFVNWLFSGDNYGATMLCHNFQGYDSYPILQYFYNNAIVPNMVPNGAKIM